MRDEALEPLSLRLPAAIREQIRKLAQANRRSLNSEAIVLLEKSLAGVKQREAS